MRVNCYSTYSQMINGERKRKTFYGKLFPLKMRYAKLKILSCTNKMGLGKIGTISKWQKTKEIMTKIKN